MNERSGTFTVVVAADAGWSAALVRALRCSLIFALSGRDQLIVDRQQG